MTTEMKLHQLKNKEAKLAFDLAVSEIPMLQEELLETIATSLEMRKAAKQVRSFEKTSEDGVTLAAVTSKFSTLFRQLLKLEEQCQELGIDSRKYFKACSDLIRLETKFDRQRQSLEDSADNAGYSLEKVCGFLYRQRD